MGNTILSRQNEPEFIKLLKAKSVAYDEADFWQTVELCIIGFSMLGPLVNIFHFKINIDVILMIYGIACFILAFIIDWVKKERSKAGAIFQELFDTQLFEIKWNPLLNIKIPQPEKIVEISISFKKDEEFMKNWYSSSIKPEIERELAVLLNQRSNLFWSKGLRDKIIKLYTIILIGYLTVILIIGIITDWIYGLGLNSFLIGYVIPMFALVKFVFNNRKTQTEIITNCENHLSKANDLMQRYIDYKILPKEDELRSLQDEIFKIRNNSSVMPYWIYKYYRTKFENTSDEAAKYYVDKILNPEF